MSLCRIEKFNATRYNIWTIRGYKDGRLAILFAAFKSINRIAQSPGRTFFNRGYYFVTSGSIRMNPRLFFQTENGSKTIGATTNVRTEATVIMNGNFLADVILPFVVNSPLQFRR